MRDKSVMKQKAEVCGRPPKETLSQQIRIGAQLFVFFFQIGCFTFGGGWSILAQMEEEFVDRRHWITKEELLDMMAVGKSVPGIMITNISMLFGYHLGGIPGGVCSVLGITCPAMIILSIVTLFYDAIKDNSYAAAVLRGIRCAVVPIMGSVALSMGRDALKNRGAQLICIAALLVSLFTEVSNIVMIAAAVLLAAGMHAAAGRGGKTERGSIGPNEMSQNKVNRNEIGQEE